MNSFVKQRILADPARADGHDANGNPGDCLTACVASLTGEPYEDVPHFAQHVSWWSYMRRWARARGADFACIVPVDGSIRHVIDEAERGLAIGSGPSPRGPFRHVVVVDEDLQLVHDPHPSDAGVLYVDEVLVWSEPYDPAPAHAQLLTAGGVR